MKKLFGLALSCCMLVSSLSVFAAAENIVIDNEVVTIPADMGSICEKDDRTFVPVRFLSEYLGCVVNYQETTHSQGDSEYVTRTATITNPATEISYFITEGDNKLYTLFPTTASITEMDTDAFINEDEGRMYIPIRFFAEALNYTVGWDEDTQTVSLIAAE